MRRSLSCGALILALTGASRTEAASTPTNFEQYELQLINRARANPNAEVTRTGLSDLNEGLSAGTISAAAKQPLAFNVNLIQAARDYSQTLINANSQLDHNYNGTTSSGRDQAAGYVFGSTSGGGENLAESSGTSSAVSINSTVVLQQHNDLFVDSGTASRGHRVTMMGDSFTEIGVGLAQSSNYTAYGSQYPYGVIATEDYAYNKGSNFLTGVAYSDNVVKDNFYTPGEGIGGMTITATPTGGGAAVSTLTWSSGGYTLALAPGTYTVTATDPGQFVLTQLGTVTIDSANPVNVEADVVNPIAVAAPEPTSLVLLALGTAAPLLRRNARRRSRSC